MVPGILLGCNVGKDTMDAVVSRLSYVARMPDSSSRVHVLVSCRCADEPALRERFATERHGFAGFDLIPCTDTLTYNQRWQMLFHHALLRNAVLPGKMLLLTEDAVPVKSNWIDMLQGACGKDGAGVAPMRIDGDCLMFPTDWYSTNEAVKYIGTRDQKLYEFLGYDIQGRLNASHSISRSVEDMTAVLVGREATETFMAEYDPCYLPVGKIVAPGKMPVEQPVPEPSEILGAEEASQLIRNPCDTGIEDYLDRIDENKRKSELAHKVPRTLVEMPLVDERFGELAVDDSVEELFGTRKERELAGGYDPDAPDPTQPPEIHPMKVVQFGSTEDRPNPQHRWYVIEIFDADADTRAQPRSREEVLCNLTTVQAAVAGYIRYANVKAAAYDRDSGLSVNTVGFRVSADKDRRNKRSLTFKDLLHVPLHKMTWNELTMGLYRPLTRYFNRKYQLVSRAELEPIVDQMRREYIKIAVEAKHDTLVGVVR